jgi:hypothetical protein
VPAGKLAVTFDLVGLPCVTGMVEAAEIETSLEVFEQGLDLHEADRDRVSVHVRLRRDLRAGWRDGDPDERNFLLVLGIWLALNHPFGANTVRASISHELRQVGKAQLTITNDSRDMWGFVVSERPAEIAELMARFPIGSNVLFDRQPAEHDRPLS